MIGYRYLQVIQIENLKIFVYNELIVVVLVTNTKKLINLKTVSASAINNSMISSLNKRQKFDSK